MLGWWRPMVMNTSTGIVVCLTLSSALSGCGEQEGVRASGCSTTASIGFETREFTAAKSLDGMRADEVQVGRRLGVGEAPSPCGDDPGRRVPVFKIVGFPTTQAVFAKPDYVYGLMARSNLDGTED